MQLRLTVRNVLAKVNCIVDTGAPGTYIKVDNTLYKERTETEEMSGVADQIVKYKVIPCTGLLINGVVCPIKHIKITPHRIHNFDGLIGLNVLDLCSLVRVGENTTIQALDHPNLIPKFESQSQKKGY